MIPPTGGDIADKEAEEKALGVVGNEALIEEARLATQAELQLSFWESVKCVSPASLLQELTLGPPAQALPEGMRMVHLALHRHRYGGLRPGSHRLLTVFRKIRRTDHRARAPSSASRRSSKSTERLAQTERRTSRRACSPLLQQGGSGLTL